MTCKLGRADGGVRGRHLRFRGAYRCCRFLELGAIVIKPLDGDGAFRREFLGAREAPLRGVELSLALNPPRRRWRSSLSRAGSPNSWRF